MISNSHQLFFFCFFFTVLWTKVCNHYNHECWLTLAATLDLVSYKRHVGEKPAVRAWAWMEAIKSRSRAEEEKVFQSVLSFFKVYGNTHTTGGWPYYLDFYVLDQTNKDSWEPMDLMQLHRFRFFHRRFFFSFSFKCLRKPRNLHTYQKEKQKLNQIYT